MKSLSYREGIGRRTFPCSQFLKSSGRPGRLKKIVFPCLFPPWASARFRRRFGEKRVLRRKCPSFSRKTNKVGKAGFPAPAERPPPWVRRSGTACSPCFPFFPLSFLSRKGPGPVRGRAARGQKADEQHKSGRNIAFRPVLCYINLVLFNMISCILFAILRKEGRNVAKCVITGKKTSFGNTRSHAMNASRRTWKANLHKVRILVNGKPKRVYVSARALKSGKVKRV